MNKFFLLFLATRFFVSIKSSTEKKETEIPVVSFNNHIKEIENDINKNKTLYLNAAETILKEGTTDHLSKLDNIFKTYFSFLQNDKFKDFLKQHNENLRKQILDFKDHYIDLNENKKLAEIKDAYNILEKTKNLINHHKDKIEFYFYSIFDNIENVKAEAKKNIENYIEDNPKKNSFKLFKTIFNSIQLPDNLISKEEINFCHEIFFWSSFFLEKNCDLSSFSSKLIENLEIVKHINFDQEFIDRILKIIIQENFEIYKDIDMYLVRNSSADKILIEIYDIIKLSFPKNKEKVKIFEKNLKIKADGDKYTLTMGDKQEEYKNYRKIKLSIEIPTINLNYEYFYAIENFIRPESVLFIFLETIKNFDQNKSDFKTFYIAKINDYIIKTNTIFDKDIVSLTIHNSYRKNTFFSIDENSLTGENSFIDKYNFIDSLNQNMHELNFDQKVWFDTLYNPCINFTKNDLSIEIEDKVQLNYCLKKIIKYIVYEKKIKNIFYINFEEQNCNFYIQNIKTEGFIEINNQLITIYKNKDEINHHINKFIQKIDKCTQIFETLSYQLAEVKCYKKVPSFFYMSYIFGYSNLKMDLFENNKLFILNPIRNIFIDLVDCKDINYNDDSDSFAEETNLEAKDLFKEYHDRLKKEFDTIFILFYNKYEKIIKEMYNSDNKKKFLSASFVDFFVKLILIEEENSIAFLKQLLDLYENIEKEKKDMAKKSNQNNFESDDSSKDESFADESSEGTPQTEKLTYDNKVHNEKNFGGKRKNDFIFNNQRDKKKVNKNYEKMKLENDQHGAQILKTDMQEFNSSKHEKNPKNLFDFKREENLSFWILFGLLMGFILITVIIWIIIFIKVKR
ncbi:hypothetical protein GVAV_002671 [Gurleya vavrai]